MSSSSTVLTSPTPSQLKCAEENEVINGAGSKEETTRDALKQDDPPMSTESKNSLSVLYGLEGMLKAVRMNNVDLNILAIGTDLTSLGLNLNNTESLSSSFVSPILEEQPSKEEVEFTLPHQYYMNFPPLKMTRLQNFTQETLFYIFYTIVGSVLQCYAAAELYNRKWVYHHTFRKWFTTATTQRQNDCTFLEATGNENGWIYFEPACWKKRFYSGYVDISQFMKPNELRELLNNFGQNVSPSGASWSDIAANHPQIGFTPNGTQQTTDIVPPDPILPNHRPYYRRPPILSQTTTPHNSFTMNQAPTPPPGFGHVRMENNYAGVTSASRPFYPNVSPSLLYQCQNNMQTPHPRLSLQFSHVRHN